MPDFYQHGTERTVHDTLRALIQSWGVLTPDEEGVGHDPVEAACRDLIALEVDLHEVARAASHLYLVTMARLLHAWADETSAEQLADRSSWAAERLSRDGYTLG